jgi:UDP-N-acetyl-D-mannosaminuronic acid dehydrogenase
MNDNTVNVIGLGYIGLPTAAIMALNNITTYGIDINKKIVSSINEGKVHIYEPGLSEIVSECVSKGYLVGKDKPQIADVHIICVPTPFKKKNKQKEPDLSFVFNAINSLLDVLKCGDLIILESTSPIGTTDRISELLQNSGFSVGDIDVAYCPERVLPGKIIQELKENNRIIGGVNLKSTTRAMNFYGKFVSGKIYTTNSKTAEMCKLAENSYRDVNIAFANELSMLCNKNNVDVWELIRLANQHPRVNILQPGPGVGGHCIAVDPWFLVYENELEAKIIRTARDVNDNKPLWVLNQVEKISINFEKIHNKTPVIACLGLAFKADIDDTRESPALEIAKKYITNIKMS